MSERTVARLLHEAGYSLQANAKTTEGNQHPDRDAQFEHINTMVRRYLKTGDPVISVDTKKKELVGESPGYKNNGREWQPQATGPGRRARLPRPHDAQGRAVRAV